MHQRSGASAVTVPVMRPRDYLFYLLGSGDDPQVAVSLVAQQSLAPIQEGCYEIALLAATEEEALLACKEFLERVSSPHEVSKLRQSRHNFHAIALDTSWPTRRFHELHWLCGNKASPASLQSLKGLADIIHIHHLQPAPVAMAPGIRVYQWTKEQDMFDFWHALYAAQSNPNSLGLDWGTYASWNPQQLIGSYTSAQAKSALQTLQHLLNRVRLHQPHTAQEALLVIEGKTTLTLAEYARIVGALEGAIKCEIAPALNLSGIHGGYRLKLLTFSRS
ncbi:hypothetical protein BHQ29_09185 [Pseudomonas sp. LPH1]|nr:hypothetical protein [Pseudomonas sp. LPH1]AQZ33445.1 hypothetical protein BHQ29_09185 [Pseudomonas sp. LPH1]